MNQLLVFGNFTPINTVLWLALDDAMPADQKIERELIFKPEFTQIGVASSTLFDGTTVTSIVLADSEY